MTARDPVDVEKLAERLRQEIYKGVSEHFFSRGFPLGAGPDKNEPWWDWLAVWLKDKIRAALREQGERIREAEYPCNLLAVIHRDGGHYIEEHGLRKATDDAIAAWYAQQERIRALEAERDAQQRQLEATTRCYERLYRALGHDATNDDKAPATAARLRRERDEWREMEEQRTEELQSACADLEATEARLREAEAQEERFKDGAKWAQEGEYGPIQPFEKESPGHPVTSALLTLSDLRRVVWEPLSDLLHVSTYEEVVPAVRAALRPPDARPAEPPADPPTCCCGNPLSLGVVHRLDGPCWIPADDQIPPSSEGPCPCGRPDRNHTHLREGR